ncbi:MAG: response regulator transcription factor [Natronospirillum sp.]
MHVLIVDDEKLARIRLELLMQEIAPDAQVLQAADTLAAQRCLQNPDLDIALVLLDIEMPGGSGLDWLTTLKQRTVPPAVIMTTAYSDYALPAIQQGADGYLLKPIKRDELEATLARVRKSHRLQSSSVTAQAARRISLHSDGTGELIDVSAVCYCSAEERWVSVVTDDREYVSHRALKEWEELDDTGLARIHRSHLVRLDALRAIQREQGVYWVTLRNNARLPVSRRHVRTLREHLKTR